MSLFRLAIAAILFPLKFIAPSAESAEPRRVVVDHPARINTPVPPIAAGSDETFNPDRIYAHASGDAMLGFLKNAPRVDDSSDDADFGDTD